MREAALPARTGPTWREQNLHFDLPPVNEIETSPSHGVDRREWEWPDAYPGSSSRGPAARAHVLPARDGNPAPAVSNCFRCAPPTSRASPDRPCRSEERRVGKE